MFKITCTHQICLAVYISVWVLRALQLQQFLPLLSHMEWYPTHSSVNHFQCQRNSCRLVGLARQVHLERPDIVGRLQVRLVELLVWLDWSVLQLLVV